jgi:hypothetical protein
MKVKELIEVLQKCDQEKEVLLFMGCRQRSDVVQVLDDTMNVILADMNTFEKRAFVSCGINFIKE